MELEFSAEAVIDAEEATVYYEEQVVGLGARFRRELESLCAMIVLQPSCGASVMAATGA